MKIYDLCSESVLAYVNNSNSAGTTTPASAAGQRRGAVSTWRGEVIGSPEKSRGDERLSATAAMRCSDARERM